MSAIAQNKAEQKSKTSGRSVGKTLEDETGVGSDRVTLSGVAGAVPLTFDPTNTNDCPSMFADKWRVGE